MRVSLLVLPIFLLSCNPEEEGQAGGTAYYISVSGSDRNEGSKAAPWQSITKLNSITFHPGDTIFLEGGSRFSGTILLDSTDSGTEEKPVVITSYGGAAIIDAGNFTALEITNARHIVVSNLHVIGSGRKDGNTQNGIAVKNSSQYITLRNVEAEGFQKSGVFVYASHDVLLEGVFAHDNGGTGILVNGFSKKTDCKRIVIRNCRAENNPGDPTNLTNHSGNGILVGNATNVLIERCVATNNGWDMPRIGNGPVGIWAYEADSVVIQYCISYRNKTSKGGEDGGGFDLDGGVTNSIIQYCLSYENEGSGFGLFQYNGASLWNNNIIRFNISENDGLVSTAHAGIYVWNGGGIAADFTNCFIYNNTIYNDKGAAIRYSAESARSKFYYYNNVFIAKDNLLEGVPGQDVFLGNSWWSLAHGFRSQGYTDFREWAAAMHQEQYNQQPTGMNYNPSFTNAGSTSLAQPAQLETVMSYTPAAGSPLVQGGLDLKTVFSIDPGQKDFNGSLPPAKGIGCCFP